MKPIMTSLLVAAILPIAGQSISAQTEDWLNPGVVERNRLPMSTSFTTDQQKTISLSGMWKFHFNPSVDTRLKGFEAVGYNDSSWDEIPVPGMLELNGYGDPLYVNIGYAWRGNFQTNPPIVPTKDNYVGQYRRTFTVDKSWIGKQICICIGSATSNVRVWVNGKEVGYSQDSKLEARFDITKAVKEGENVIALEVFRWCDGSYLEDQDFWRFTGIARGIYVYTREKKRIEDIHIKGDMDGNFSVYAEVTPGVTSVDYILTDPSGKQVASFTTPVARKFEESENGNVALRYEGKISSPELWSAEDPNLYKLSVTAKDSKGVCESASVRMGFRTVEVKGAQFLVNGKQVLIKGVDRHEIDPYKGYVLSREDMIRDIRIMKELNVNAVRTSHYPNDPIWYDLCDEYGIYVTDEANIESHGMGYGEASLAHRTDFTLAHMQRGQRMVQRDFNHPCVVVWSLGNEAGNGVNFYQLYDWIKAYDSSRPVQYERAGRDRNTDIYCPMYLGVEGAIRYATSNPDRPLIQCEYAHAMGNSIGNFKEYWDAVRKYPAYQGGYIWDFVDQAISWPVNKEGTDHIFAFGGDFNDHDASDGSFNCNGVIAADRTYHPHSYEVRYQYRSILTTPASLEGDIKVNVYNENFFINLDRYRMEWSVEAEGQRILTGIVEKIDAAPGQTVTVPLGITLDQIKEAAAEQCCCADDIYLNVNFVLKKKDGLLPAGSIVSYDQIAISESEGPSFDPGSAAAGSSIKYEGGKFSGSFVYSDGTQGKRVSSWEIAFTDGAVSSYRIDGKSLIEEPLMPAFGRAPIENDLGARNELRSKMWMYPEFKVESTDVRKDGDNYIVRTVYQPLEGKAKVAMTYTIYPDGTIEGKESLLDAGGLSECPDLLRFGMEFTMGGKYSNLEFFGKGPFENYADRNSAALMGHYKQTVNEQYHYGYVRTQESGTKTGMKYFRVTDANGTGLEITSDKKFSASALPFGRKTLDLSIGDPRPRPNPTNTQSGKAQHSLEMKALAFENDREKGKTFVNFDMVQMGVGGDNSWGARPMEPYLIHAKEMDFNFIIRPVNN